MRRFQNIQGPVIKFWTVSMIRRSKNQQPSSTDAIFSVPKPSINHPWNKKVGDSLLVISGGKQHNWCPEGVATHGCCNRTVVLCPMSADRCPPPQERGQNLSGHVHKSRSKGLEEPSHIFHLNSWCSFFSLAPHFFIILVSQTTYVAEIYNGHIENHNFQKDQSIWWLIYWIL